APAEPEAAAASQRLAQGDREAARSARALARQRDTIGDDYQPRQNAASQLLLSRMADTISPTREWVCGKLPHSSPVAESMSSDSRPARLHRARIFSNSARASSRRPTATRASMYQNVHTVKAVSGIPKSSGRA